MIATRPHQVRIVLFTRMSADLGATDTLLGRALCTVDGEPIPEVLVYREPDRRLAVAIPVHSHEYALPWEVQRLIARKVKRYVRRLERSS